MTVVARSSDRKTLVGLGESYTGRLRETPTKSYEVSRSLDRSSFDGSLLTADHPLVPVVPASDKRAKRIQIRVTPEIYETIMRVAAADKRSVAHWAAIVVEEAAERGDRKLKSKSKSGR